MCAMKSKDPLCKNAHEVQKITPISILPSGRTEPLFFLRIKIVHAEMRQGLRGR